MNPDTTWVALFFGHQAIVEFLAQAASQGLAHYKVAFVLFRGKLAQVLAFHQDDMAGRQKKHIGLSTEHPSCIASTGVESLVGNACSQEAVIPARPTTGCGVSDLATGSSAPHLLYPEIVGKTEEAIVVSDELVLERSLAPALVVLSGEDVSQRKA